MASGKTLGASGWGQETATVLQQREMAQRPSLSSAQSSCSLCSSTLIGWVINPRSFAPHSPLCRSSRPVQSLVMPASAILKMPHQSCAT